MLDEIAAINLASVSGRFQSFMSSKGGPPGEISHGNFHTHPLEFFWLLIGGERVT